MRTIKNLNAIQWKYVYAIVNSPPGNQQGFTQAEARNRDELFEAVTGPVRSGKNAYDFNRVDGRDLVLTESAWDELKKAFDLTAYPTMEDRVQCLEIQDLVKNAKYTED